ncbi:MAG: hypothetical protein IPI35_02915 [Deltaproteobacteria bacterium]|nr:hypothetical protein [Deltaproteobacteria bacterium]
MSRATRPQRLRRTASGLPHHPRRHDHLRRPGDRPLPPHPLCRRRRRLLHQRRPHGQLRHASASDGKSTGKACADGSDGNQLVRDPINNLLYCYDTEGGSATTYVYAWTTDDHFPKPAKFNWATPAR